MDFIQPLIVTSCFSPLSFMEIKTPSLSLSRAGISQIVNMTTPQARPNSFVWRRCWAIFTLSVVATTESSRWEIPTIRKTPGDVGLADEEDTRWKHAWERRSAGRRWRSAAPESMRWEGNTLAAHWAENTMWRQREPVLLPDLHQNYPLLGIFLK